MAQLLREAIGGTIRRARTERRRTLRDVSKDARVSLGYLSEIERGRKEPSSELLAAICDALALPLPDLLDDVADSMRPVREPAMARRRLVGVDPALLSAVEEALEGAGDDAAEAVAPAGESTAPAAAGEVVDLAEAPTGVPADAGSEDDPEVVEPAGELRLVELVTLGRAAGTVRSAA